MARLLPPLLVVALLIALGARVAARPSRTPRQSQISSLVFGGNRIAAKQELERYAVDFTDADDRWFAAEMELRLGDIDAGLDTIWSDDALRADPATARRFAILALGVLGWGDRDHTQENADTAACLVTLVEGRCPWAEDILRHKAATDDLLAATRYFFPVFRERPLRPLEIILEEFRKRDEETFRIAVAMTAVRDPESRRADDIAALRRVVASEQWRTQHTDVWRACCFALGQCKDEEGLATLRARLDTLEATKGRMVDEDKEFVRIGLFASGDWSQHQPLFRRVLEPEHYQPSIASWALKALLHLVHTGDTEARHIVGDVWALPGDKHPQLRHEITRSILLREETPDETAIPVAHVLQSLQEERAPLLSHMLARSYLMRRGQEGGLDDVLTGLREAGRLLQVPGADPEVLHTAVRAGLRALLLFAPGTSPHRP